MPYLIDGHNLIGKMPHIHLDDPDDEMQLVHILVEFLNKVKRSGTVYFDKRAPGVERKFRSGRLLVEFMTSPNTADLAIRSKLRALKGEARNYTVVSSDHEVIQAARVAESKVIDSVTFTRQITDPQSTQDVDSRSDTSLSSEEIRFWQKLFGDPSEE